MTDAEKKDAEELKKDTKNTRKHSEIIEKQSMKKKNNVNKKWRKKNSTLQTKWREEEVSSLLFLFI